MKGGGEFKRVSSIRRRNQSMSTLASEVSLGLTEAVLRVQAYTFKFVLKRALIIIFLWLV